jgi:hypothetical protein
MRLYRSKIYNVPIGPYLALKASNPRAAEPGKSPGFPARGVEHTIMPQSESAIDDVVNGSRILEMRLAWHSQDMTCVGAATVNSRTDTGLVRPVLREGWRQRRLMPNSTT